MVVGKGGFLTSPRFPRGESVSAVTSPRPLRATAVVACVVDIEPSVAVLASTTDPASALASAPASAPAAAPAAEPRGGGFVVDLPYQMHNNYES